MTITYKEKDVYDVFDLFPQDEQDSMRVTCPKCQSMSAFYTADHQDVTLKCMCGYHKVVATKLESILTEHIDAGSEISLPKRSTKLWEVLMAVSIRARLSTREVTDIVNGGRAETLTTSDIASQLTILRYKGLVEVLSSRKGVAGGSIWTLTVQAKKLLGV